MITDNRPLSSSDASSRVPILLRRTLDSSFCRDDINGISVGGHDTSRPYKSDFRCSDLPETLRWYRIELSAMDAIHASLQFIIGFWQGQPDPVWVV